MNKKGFEEYGKKKSGEEFDLAKTLIEIINEVEGRISEMRESIKWKPNEFAGEINAVGVLKNQLEIKMNNDWAGKYGVDYAKRCVVNPKKRIPIFYDLLWDLNIQDTLEVGCNTGHNLKALESIVSGECLGVEINKKLCNKPSIINGNILSLPWDDSTFDLVFSAGVLIHIPADKLTTAINEMVRVSHKYIMMIEYYSEKEKSINCKEIGTWKRSYGEIFSGLFPKTDLVKEGHIKDLGCDDGWDFSRKCTYWIFRKGN